MEKPLDMVGGAARSGLKNALPLEHLGPQTLQLLALSYFAGIFGFPLTAGSLIVDVGPTPLLVLVAVLAAIEATLAMRRWVGQNRCLFPP